MVGGIAHHARQFLRVAGCDDDLREQAVRAAIRGIADYVTNACVHVFRANDRAQIVDELLFIGAQVGGGRGGVGWESAVFA